MQNVDAAHVDGPVSRAIGNGQQPADGDLAAVVEDIEDDKGVGNGHHRGRARRHGDEAARGLGADEFVAVVVQRRAGRGDCLGVGELAIF